MGKDYCFQCNELRSIKIYGVYILEIKDTVEWTFIGAFPNSPAAERYLENLNATDARISWHQFNGNVSSVPTYYKKQGWTVVK